MQVNIEELVSKAGVQEPLYPGKKLVKKYVQPGEYKSHCVIFDWRDSGLVKLELKAGLTGKDMDLSNLKNYLYVIRPQHICILKLRMKMTMTKKG